jgi:hypothetical protein
MYQEEEEVIHLDYNSEDEYEIPDDVADDSDESDDDGGGESESKLMEYLLKGLVLQSTTCGACDTPLIKSLVPDENPVTLTSSSPIIPIGKVPYCVSCVAHVVTNQEELQVLWKDEYKALMSVSGAVLLFMDEECQSAQPVFGKMSLASGSESEGEKESDDVEEIVEPEEENTESDVESLPEVEPEIEVKPQSEPGMHTRPRSSHSRSGRSVVPTRPSSSLAKQRPGSSRSVARSTGSGSFVLTDEEEMNFDLIDYDKR